MLAKRVIPSILVRGKTAYKGERFNSARSIGSALAVAKVHARRGVDELCILDISATAEGRGPDLDLVRELSEGCFIPITVGGGVRSVDDINALLRAGADKVCIGTAVPWVESDLLRNASDRFGRQAIVVSLDFEAGLRRTQSGRCLNGTTRSGKPFTPADWAKVCEEQGAGELLVTSIDRDGMLNGYDLGLIREVSAAVDIPVIAAGGCGTYQHMLDAFQAGADACASGAMFQFTDATPRGAANFLKERGLCVRL